jgi:hypothetical protein
MKLTNEELASVFAMYKNAQCHVGLYNYTTTIYAVSNTDIQLEKGPTDYPQHFISPSVWKVQLLLTPLSDISDEHAIEVAKILGVSYSNNPESEAHFDITGLAFYLKELFELNGELREIASYRIIQCFQYLISKGYDVPLWFGIDHWANGQTAIQLGIAIDKTKQP